jgi:hypothetical protein
MKGDEISTIVGNIVHELNKVSDENLRLLILNEVMSRVCSANTGTKVQSSGLAELVACTVLGLTWQKDSIHGRDASDEKGRAVELKTSKRSKAGNVNFKYNFPEKSRGQSSLEHRNAVFELYMSNRKYEGGHYLIFMNAAKTRVLSWYWVSKRKMAELAANYAAEHPTSKSMNFGRKPCKNCGHCCWLVGIATKMFALNKKKDAFVPLKCNTM